MGRVFMEIWVGAVGISCYERNNRETPPGLSNLQDFFFAKSTVLCKLLKGQDSVLHVYERKLL